MVRSLIVTCLLVSASSLFLGCGGSQDVSEEGDMSLKTGVWRGVLHSPGGELPFRLELEKSGDKYSGLVVNDSERLAFDSVTVAEGGTVSFRFEHYDSVIKATLQGDGTLRGEWSMVYNHERIRRLPFGAVHGEVHRFKKEIEDPPVQISGRWSIRFVHEAEPPTEAVAEFTQSGNDLTGTFMTPTGDYRFLQGNVFGNKLYLSVFDAGHAFLFTATLNNKGELHGDFWSAESWHETWSGHYDPDAVLPDPFAMTRLEEGLDQFRFQFPDLEGKMVSHDDLFLKGKVRIISIFGSWCPNCNDELPFLQELYDRYHDDGFEVIGLAFEATGNKQRDTRMLKHFIKRHRLTFPILLAGTRDKEKAGELLPDINHVLAFPTTVFVGRDGKVAFIHTGFSGPGTGVHYERLKTDYHRKVGELLNRAL